MEKKILEIVGFFSTTGFTYRITGNTNLNPSHPSNTKVIIFVLKPAHLDLPFGGLLGIGFSCVGQAQNSYEFHCNI